MTAPARRLAEILTARSAADAEALLAESSVRAATFDRARFDQAFGSAGRRLGNASVGGDATLVDAESGASRSSRDWAIASWGLDEVARALLLLESMPRVPESEQVAWVDDCYRAGALRERTAILRALAAFPDPPRFLAIALDACRTSTQPVFEAIACENPYPAACFPEASFNQMVLKAVFTEVALARIVDLDTRLGPELARMASAYASERRAAGRSVPTDLDRLVAR